MRKHTILFDFDGTLYSTDALVMKCFRHTLARWGVGAVSDERLKQTFGALMADVMRGFVEEYHLDADYREMIEEYRAYQHERFDAEAFAFEGIPQMLESLRRQGCRMAVLTSRKRRSTLQGLLNAGILDYFELVQTSDDTDKVKPDPMAALEVLEKLGESPKKAMIVGDSSYDILCGRHAGLLTALAVWGRAMNPEKIKELSPDLVLSAPLELAERLKQYG